MNVSHSSAPKRPSKLLEALRDRSHTGGAGRLGFGAHSAGPKRRLVLVASIAVADLARLAAVAEAGADGIEVQVRSARELRAVTEATAGLGIPLGIALGGDIVADLDPTEVATGIDWIRLSLAAGMAPLNWEKPARFMTIPPDLDVRRAPALNLLEIDAVVIEAHGSNQGSLTIGDLLPLAMLGEILKKPLLMHGAIGFGPALAGVAEQCGANGLLVPVEASTAAATIGEYARALEQQAGKA
ncbi:MAG TPA: hypothetical protein VNL71_00460 [Chloroflexota bacterium]|nr:hypothetical protein [Chloroflexota bacterium]